jgi:hypothetical protein
VWVCVCDVMEYDTGDIGCVVALAGRVLFPFPSALGTTSPPSPPASQASPVTEGRRRRTVILLPGLLVQRQREEEDSSSLIAVTRKMGLCDHAGGS